MLPERVSFQREYQELSTYFALRESIKLSQIFPRVSRALDAFSENCRYRQKNSRRELSTVMYTIRLDIRSCMYRATASFRNISSLEICACCEVEQHDEVLLWSPGPAINSVGKL